MTDKENLESFVNSALRSRIEGGAQSVVELRRHLTDEIERVESAIRSAGEKPISIPDELIPAPTPAPAPAPVDEAADQGALLAHIRSSQEEMLAATEQVALLTHLLTACTVSCPRVAFFIARKDGLVGWAARGFEEIPDAEIRSLKFRFDQDTILGAAHRAASTVHGAPGRFSEDGELLSRLGGGDPAEMIAVPVFLRDKIAAVLYGDSGTTQTIVDPEVPQVLALHAGLCLETLSTRQKYPRPKPVAAGPARSAPSVDRADTPQPSNGGDLHDADSSSGAVERHSGFTPSGGFPAASPAPPPPPQAEEYVEEADEEAEPEEVSGPSRAVATPAPGGPDLESLTDEERKLHQEAKRFARLLVSEMVLYNEKQVEEGRRNKDLYERLKDDIDRSHQMYEQRIDASVRATSNYFHDEMVRTLANGDEGALKVPWA